MTDVEKLCEGEENFYDSQRKILDRIDVADIEIAEKEKEIADEDDVALARKKLHSDILDDQ